MKNMILLDIETLDFDVSSGIYEVALLVIQEDEVIEQRHIAEVENEDFLHVGMGNGYADISTDSSKIEEFKYIINKYQYPIVAHNVAFDRKFLVYYGWLDEEYTCYDTVRAIKYSHPYLFSYSLEYLKNFFKLNNKVTHQALDDVHILFEIVTKADAENWIPLYKPSPQKFQSIVKTTTAHLTGKSTIFTGKVIVFTGKSPFQRILMEEIAQKSGGITRKSVTRKTDLLIIGEEPGNKLKKAQELDVEIQTDQWFIDAISKDLDLDTAYVTREKDHQPIEEKKEKFSLYKKLTEFKGQKVNIALMPLRYSKKVEDILVNHLEVTDIIRSSAGYKVDTIIYYDNKKDDYKLLKKAQELNINVLPLSAFNRMLLNS